MSSSILNVGVLAISFQISTSWPRGIAHFHCRVGSRKAIQMQQGICERSEDFQETMAVLTHLLYLNLLFNMLKKLIGKLTFSDKRFCCLPAIWSLILHPAIDWFVGLRADHLRFFLPSLTIWERIRTLNLSFFSLSWGNLRYRVEKRNDYYSR